MSDDDVIVLVGGIDGIPGSKQFSCYVCQVMVWIAPSGQKLIADKPAVAVVCIQCAMKGMESAGTASVGVLPDALKELAIWRKRN
jgi:hypothetical protein